MTKTLRLFVNDNETAFTKATVTFQEGEEADIHVTISDDGLLVDLVQDGTVIGSARLDWFDLERLCD
jgi:hypothetical protein